MNNSKALQQYLLSRIQLPETQGEIESIVYLVLAHFFQLTHTDVLRNKAVTVTDEDLKLLDTVIARINNHEPVQYITGVTWFYRRCFDVSPAVLIPRPETEELIQQVISHVRQRGLVATHILDLCTGSGCIPVTLGLEIATSKVLATDISEEALRIARLNAAKHHVTVDFHLHNILTDQITLTNFDIITANPPYIRESEKEMMSRNVLDFEPHLALFVPNNDPLIFYKVIAEKAYHALRHEGMLIVEVNEHFGHAVADLFASVGFLKIEIVYDLSQKQRIVRAIKA
jgi:release factor glutamine methyltransferase